MNVLRFVRELFSVVSYSVLSSNITTRRLNIQSRGKAVICGTGRQLHLPAGFPAKPLKMRETGFWSGA